MPSVQAEIVPVGEVRALFGAPAPDSTTVQRFVKSLRKYGFIVPLVVRRAVNDHVVQEGRQGWKSGWFVIDPRLAAGAHYKGVPPFFRRKADAEAAVPMDVPYEVVDGIKRLAAARKARISQIPILIADLSDDAVAELRAKN